MKRKTKADLLTEIEQLQRRIGELEATTKPGQAEDAGHLAALMEGLAATGVGVDIISSDYRVISQNNVLTERFGDLTGELCYKSYVGIDEPCESCSMKKALSSGDGQRAEVRAADGRDYEILSAPLAAPDGTPDRVIEVVLDITERKRAEERLEHLNAVLRALRNVNQLIVHEKDRTSLLDEACRCLVETRGYHNAWIALVEEGRPVQPVYHAGFGRSFAPMAELLERGEMTECGRRALSEPGAIVIENPVAECGDCPLSGKYSGRSGVTVRLEHAGKVYGALSVSVPAEMAADPEELSLFGEVAGDIAFALHDIEIEDARRQAEREIKASNQQLGASNQQLRATEQQLRASNQQLEASSQQLRASAKNLKEAQRVAHVGSWDLNVVTGDLYWSDEVYRIYGFEPQEFVPTDEKFMSILYPEDHERVQQSVDAALSGAAEYDIDFRFVRPNGEIGWIHCEGEVTRDEQGAPIRFFGIQADITDRKQAEQALRETEDQFRQAQKMEAVGRLAGGVAHDFNNMLSAIIGYSDLMLMGVKEGDPMHSDIGNIKKCADQAVGLTRQLLAFSRKQTLQPKVLNLNDIVTGTESMLRRLIGEDIDLVTSFSSDLGRVKADPGQVEQIVMNLAVNSRDAMPDGGKLTIETADVELDEEYARLHADVTPGPHVMLAVTDDGSGMDQETQARIFEPFFTTKEMDKGTGLGLSTVYGIVKQSGGNIWVYSEPGKGTTFKIYLPRVEEAAEKIERPKAVSLRRGTETVLVVEDEDAVRELVCRILQVSGYKVLEAPHGGEALVIAEQHEGAIDLIITDVVMPHMGGRELAERLAKMRPGIKVLFTSGYTDNAIVHQGVLDEDTAFIQKPYTVSSLLAKVREVLEA